MIIDHCGSTTSKALPQTIPFVVDKDNKLSTAIDTNGIWAHDVNHTHYIVIDLLKPRYLTNIRGVLNNTTNVQHVFFYVTNDLADYGDPVLEIADWQAYTKDDDDPWEYVMGVPKVGRYVKIEVTSTTDTSNYLRWG
jgi:hypothetical protein